MERGRAESHGEGTKTTEKIEKTKQIANLISEEGD